MKFFILRMITKWVSHVTITNSKFNKYLLTLVTVIGTLFYRKKKFTSTKVVNFYIDPTVLSTHINLYKLITDTNLDSINFLVSRSAMKNSLIEKELRYSILFTGHVTENIKGEFYGYCLIWLRILYPSVDFKLNISTNQLYSYIYFIFAVTSKRFNIELNQVDFYDDGSATYNSAYTWISQDKERLPNHCLEEAFIEIGEVFYRSIYETSPIKFVIKIHDYTFNKYCRRQLRLIYKRYQVWNIKENQCFLSSIPSYLNLHNLMNYYYILDDFYRRLIEGHENAILLPKKMNSFQMNEFFKNVNNHSKKDLLLRVLSNYEDISFLESINKSGKPLLIVISTVHIEGLNIESSLEYQINSLSKMIADQLDRDFVRGGVTVAYKGHPRCKRMNKQLFTALQQNFKNIEFIEFPSSISTELLVSQIKNQITITGMFTTSVLIFAKESRVNIGEFDYITLEWLEDYVKKIKLLN